MFPKGKGNEQVVQNSSSANTERPRIPRKLPNQSKPTGSGSQTTADQSSKQAEHVDDDVLPDEAVPRNNDKDEEMFPDLVISLANTR